MSELALTMLCTTPAQRTSIVSWIASRTSCRLTARYRNHDRLGSICLRTLTCSIAGAGPSLRTTRCNTTGAPTSVWLSICNFPTLTSHETSSSPSVYCPLIPERERYNNSSTAPSSSETPSPPRFRDSAIRTSVPPRGTDPSNSPSSPCSSSSAPARAIRSSRVGPRALTVTCTPAATISDTPSVPISTSSDASPPSGPCTCTTSVCSSCGFSQHSTSPRPAATTNAPSIAQPNCCTRTDPCGISLRTK
mmetsp:Transcript_7662/g.15182  ORF Transcript_7662/g.15182 Transcript_7662/m.15182 type:complete len:249 (-) Transcript_7662:462-1208(-)